MLEARIEEVAGSKDETIRSKEETIAALRLLIDHRPPSEREPHRFRWKWVERLLTVEQSDVG